MNVLPLKTAGPPMALRCRVSASAHGPARSHQDALHRPAAQAFAATGDNALRDLTTIPPAFTQDFPAPNCPRPGFTTSISDRPPSTARTRPTPARPRHQTKFLPPFPIVSSRHTFKIPRFSIGPASHAPFRGSVRAGRPPAFRAVRRGRQHYLANPVIAFKLVLHFHRRRFSRANYVRIT